MKRSALILLGLLLLAGCGGGSGSAKEQARAVGSEFLQAYSSGEGRRACELMTSKARLGVVRRAERGGDSSGLSCEQAIAASGAPADAPQIGRMVVHDGRAVAYLESRSGRLPLKDVDGHWRVGTSRLVR